MAFCLFREVNVESSCYLYKSICHQLEKKGQYLNIGYERFLFLHLSLLCSAKWILTHLLVNELLKSCFSLVHSWAGQWSQTYLPPAADCFWGLTNRMLYFCFWFHWGVQCMTSLLRGDCRWPIALFSSWDWARVEYQRDQIRRIMVNELKTLVSFIVYVWISIKHSLKWMCGVWSGFEICQITQEYNANSRPGTDTEPAAQGMCILLVRH